MGSASWFESFYLRRTEIFKMEFDYKHFEPKMYEAEGRKIICTPAKSHIKKVAIKSIFYDSPSTSDSYCRLKHK